MARSRCAASVPAVGRRRGSPRRARGAALGARRLLRRDDRCSVRRWTCWCCPGVSSRCCRAAFPSCGTASRAWPGCALPVVAVPRAAGFSRPRPCALGAEADKLRKTLATPAPVVAPGAVSVSGHPSVHDGGCGAFPWPRQRRQGAARPAARWAAGAVMSSGLPGQASRRGSPRVWYRACATPPSWQVARS